MQYELSGVSPGRNFARHVGVYINLRREYVPDTVGFGFEEIPLRVRAGIVRSVSRDGARFLHSVKASVHSHIGMVTFI
jgi:hypothetical protein